MKTITTFSVRFIAVLLLLALSFSFNSARYFPPFSVSELRKHLSYLASEQLEGRRSGGFGDLLAAEYIRNEFLKNKLTLLSDKGFQYFEVITDVEIPQSNTFIVDGLPANLLLDFQPYSFSGNAAHNGTVVFASYGFYINRDSFVWNDYDGVDVKEKWVLLLNDEPRIRMYQQFFSDYSDVRTKVLNAKDMGAKGVLMVSSSKINATDKLDEIYLDRVMSQLDIPVIQISRKLANRMLAGNGLNIDSLEQMIENKKSPVSFPTSVVVEAVSEVNFVRKQTQNVVALLEGYDPKLKNEFVVIGAHYDHLGLGGKNSGSRNPDITAIHPGADDNASGVAALIELSRVFASNRESVKRSILFVAFGAEEIGLLGSRYFVNNAPVPLDKMVAMFNFDMFGRLKREDMSLMVGGVGTSEEGDSLVNYFGNKHGFNLKLSADGFGASDHASFYGKSIPVFFISTGAHQDYHLPADVMEKIDFEGMKLVMNFSMDVALEVINRDKKLTFKESGSFESSAHRGYKVTLGLVPDFTATKINGLRVESVRHDGPAHKGGMQDGDVIIALEGREVGNIYDYMNRLKDLQKGQIITVDIIRKEEKIVLIIQL